MLFMEIHLTRAEYTFFSSGHGIYTKLDYMLPWFIKQTSINLKEFKSNMYVLSDHNEIKLLINNRETKGKSPNT